MEGLEHRVRETMEQYHMLEPGDRVIAAVSGGADSVCLLALLCAWREPRGISIRALHVHHGLRGEEADRDADFVRSLCEGLHVPCHILKVDVRGLAAEKGMSEEEAGRFLRYEALEKEALDWEGEDRASGGRSGLDEDWADGDWAHGDSADGGLADGGSADGGPADGGPADGGPVVGGAAGSSLSPVKIAVAHHSGDQVETILHNLFRGSGLFGMKGIVYRRGRIIRPLLDVDRDCILKWLADHDLPYVQDSTNDTLHYTRNRIRNQLLPEIEQYVNRGAAGNILRLGRLAAQADEYLESQAAAWIKAHVRKNPGAYIPAEAFLLEPEILRSYVVMSLLKELGGASRDLGLVHVSQVMELAGRAVGKQVDLPYGLSAIREYEGIWMGRGDPAAEEEWGDLPIVDMEVFSRKKGMEFPKNVYTKWFDCDKIKGTPVVRTRRPGDFIVLSDNNHKALNRFMIDEKIPRQMRDKIPLLADGSHVMWIIGYRISEYYKIGPDTVRVLQAEAGQTGERKE